MRLNERKPQDLSKRASAGFWFKVSGFWLDLLPHTIRFRHEEPETRN
jgi:hypothetical protein